ncbi:hypothetical protein L6164_001733 [Bauhinia variegata]|uniref:Uncharacterized protein n=1 Tax=Bauhinia variegata TaxID=167791 RepID=A0ACB9Q9P9_BAUVA|nr:hypothetical protein L6164_001733 [Bauhinia variegata]
MEVPVVQRFSDLQVDLSSLQYPSLAGVQSIAIAFNFCKWGAVILALVAAFGSIIKRVKILIIRFQREKHSLPSFPLLSELDDDDFCSSDDEGSYSPLSSTPSSEFEEEEDEPSPSASSSFTWRQIDEDFRVRGSGHRFDDQLQNGHVMLRRRRSIGEIFSLSELANSQSVVKLWDSIGFGLGLDFDDADSSSENMFSVYDGKTPVEAVSNSLPPVVVSAGSNGSGNLEIKIWDTRLRCRIPAGIADWGPQLGKIVGVGSSGVQKVYVRDDAGYGVTVGDMRNVNSPLRKVTKSDGDTWWDADAVIVTDEGYGDDPAS